MYTAYIAYIAKIGRYHCYVHVHETAEMRGAVHALLKVLYVIQNSIACMYARTLKPSFHMVVKVS